jgi:anti-sigma-K factor RskA
MSEMNNEIFEDLKDAYVLDALPEEERRAFDNYLAAHPERQAEIDELGSVAGLLAFAPHEQEPSPQLRSGILEIVKSEASPRRARREPALARFWGYLGARGLALGAAALLVVGLFSWNLLLQGQVGDLQGEVQNSQDQVQDLRGQVQEAQAQRQIKQTPTIALTGSWADQGANAEVASIDKDQVILVANNMPSVPDNRTCQIWVIKGDSPPSPSGLFQPDGNMTATPITTPIEKADTVAVTVEPAGGSDQPTTEPVLQAKL